MYLFGRRVSRKPGDEELGGVEGEAREEGEEGEEESEEEKGEGIEGSEGDVKEAGTGDAEEDAERERKGAGP